MIDSGPKTHSCATLTAAPATPQGRAPSYRRARPIKASREAMLRQGGLRSVIRGKDDES
jgi:hypothetical protein